ncbi:hypothetical protein BSZ19_19255 [Bradyrhizobium japonicum]|uniref:Uncharacterized protein n=1 Tax=Bradyrhizobium japonicum TaxID=375 RepID=A0A1Y2JQ53_BRAJP|nr:hypothetical protein BSZ19_19255 [Bradyrhizobium japonicum]
MQEDAARHLALPATGQLPSAAYKGTGRPCSYNALLQRLGVSGFYSFDEAWANAGLYPACRVTRHMVGIARGVQFMAGRVRRNACASEGSFVGPASGPEGALIAGLDAPRVAAALGENHAVLEASLEGLAARQIADTGARPVSARLSRHRTMRWRRWRRWSNSSRPSNETMVQPHLRLESPIISPPR